VALYRQLILYKTRTHSKDWVTQHAARRLFVFSAPKMGPLFASSIGLCFSPIKRRGVGILGLGTFLNHCGRSIFLPGL
jgi:hypothetical protein